MLHRVRELWKKKDTGLKHKNILIIVAFIVGCGGVALAIAQYIDQYHVSAARAASVAYSDLLEYAQDKNKKPETRVKAAHLIEHYPQTVYADMTRLMLAETAQQEGHTLAAQAYLKAVLNHKKSALIHVARLRLARLLAEEQRYEDALATLDTNARGGFEPLYETAKGDIYMAMQSIEKANAAYTQAIETMPAGVSDPWLQLKQADIGGQG